jgi:ABC-2 type transport system permease protein
MWLAALVLIALFCLKSVVIVLPIVVLYISAGIMFPIGWAFIITCAGLFFEMTIGFFIGLRISSPMTIVIAIVVMAFVGLVFAGFGLFIASKTRSIRTFQVVTMAITMPMTFLSGAYIPLSLLPNELVVIAYFNPMTYAVALFRAIVLEKTSLSHAQLMNEGLAFQIGSFVITPFTAMLILLVFGAVFLVLSTLSFIKTDFSRINRIKNDAIEW